jgi:hypothetical protein
MAWHWRHPENGRWQLARLEHDLLTGGLLLVTRSGGIQRHGMAQRSYPISTRAELRQVIRTIRGRRKRHHYGNSPYEKP